jgi:hypothetical protein
MKNNSSPGAGEQHEEKLSAQQQRVLSYLHQHDTITPNAAYEEVGTLKLSTIISELRRIHGIDILKIPVKSINRYGEPVRFMSYSLKYRHD